jgi:hypothetical protein
MSYGVGVIFICLAMALIVGMVYQALAYAHGRQIISPRQFRLRMANGVLLLVTIGLVFYAALARFSNPLVALAFWGVVTLLPLVVVILAWLDLRQVARARHEQQAQLYRNLAHLEHDLKDQPDKRDSP